jgi:hypothetical protein
LNLAWGAEIRLESQMTEEATGATLAEGGCIALSFGLEAGSQRVLDLINKGIKLERVGALLKDLRDNQIHVQLMGFTGFPTESEVEARQTYDFLLANKDKWSLAAIGNFVLTPGSMIAKEPGKFGIAELIPKGRGDVIGEYSWRNKDDLIFQDGTRNNTVCPPDSGSLLMRGALRRPFVGGTDTAHTLLYFRRYRTIPLYLNELSNIDATPHPHSVPPISYLGAVEALYADIRRIGSRDGLFAETWALLNEEVPLRQGGADTAKRGLGPS